DGIAMPQVETQFIASLPTNTHQNIHGHRGLCSDRTLFCPTYRIKISTAKQPLKNQRKNLGQFRIFLYI
ncbi:MAG: hypothetical protein CVV50_04600, partial [Spirochaetae bacterium HGW-Spirochaetae-6]